MKANVPERIYWTPTKGGFYFTTIKPEPPFAEGVEYNRTDAFIAKACAWFRTLDNKEPPYKTTEEFIEGFKYAMKGE